MRLEGNDNLIGTLHDSLYEYPQPLRREVAKALRKKGVRLPKDLV